MGSLPGPQTHQVPSCLRAFALAAASASLSDRPGWVPRFLPAYEDLLREAASPYTVRSPDSHFSSVCFFPPTLDCVSVRLLVCVS